MTWYEIIINKIDKYMKSVISSQWVFISESIDQNIDIMELIFIITI